MAVRKIIFEEKQQYHIFNRGVDKKIIFHDKEDVKYFLDRLADFNNDRTIGGVARQGLIKNKKLRSPASQLVSIVAYCILPNHFHLLLKQVDEKGVTKFIQRIATGYAKYYNKKYKRSGALFQGRFKATELKGRGSLELLSVYVNLNYKHHGIDQNKDNVISSLDEYLNKEELGHSRLCNKDEVNNIIGKNVVRNKQLYIKYSKMQSKEFARNKGLNVEGVKFDELEK